MEEGKSRVEREKEGQKPSWAIRRASGGCPCWTLCCYREPKQVEEGEAEEEDFWQLRMEQSLCNQGAIVGLVA